MADYTSSWKASQVPIIMIKSVSKLFLRLFGRLPTQDPASYVARLHKAPPLRIDTNVTAQELDRLLASTTKVWERLGQTEPHWSVLTSPNYKQSAVTPLELSRFFESGQSEYETMVRAFARAGLSPDGLSKVLEIGCGVGRVTGWLAQHHDKVLATDISQAHLALAQAHLEDLGRKNVEFLHVKALQDLELEPRFDLVYSVIVLQHNPPPVILEMLARCIGGLTAGGYAFFQVPTYIFGYEFKAGAYVPNPEEMEMHCVPLPVLLEFIGRMNCRVLDLFEDDCPGHHSIVSHTFLIRREA